MRIAVDGRSLTREQRGVSHYLAAMLAAMRPLDPDVEWDVVHRTRADVARRRRLAGDVIWMPAPAPVALGGPLVLTVQDRSWERRPQDFTRYEHLWHRIARPRHLARRAAIVLTTTEAGRRDVIEAWGLEPEKVRVTPLAPAVPLTPRAVDTDDPYFLFVGAFEPRKGIDLLVEAARLGGSRVIAVGGGRVPTPGLEVRTGVDDQQLSQLYAGALALIQPSRLEGFGLPAVEALAHGTPAIVTDLPEVREATQGRATYVPVDDPQALADAMRAHQAPAHARATRVHLGRGGPHHPQCSEGSGGMTLAVLTVLHRSAAEFAVLRASLDRYLPHARVIAVDTAADDGGAALADVGVDARDNPGFGAANNAGLEHVTEPVTILLNPDTELRDAGLATLATLARDHDALLVPKLVRPDGTQERSVHPLPGTLRALVPALLPAPRRLEPWRSPVPRTVGWAVAAAVVARTDLLRSLGPFDPRIHLHYEDMDLCLRARALGVPTVFHPAVTVIHTGSHSTGEPHAARARSRREVVRHHRGRKAAALDEVTQTLTFATRALGGQDRARARAQLRGQLQ